MDIKRSIEIYPAAAVHIRELCRFVTRAIEDETFPWAWEKGMPVILIPDCRRRKRRMSSFSWGGIGGLDRSKLFGYGMRDDEGERGKRRTG